MYLELGRNVWRMIDRLLKVEGTPAGSRSHWTRTLVPKVVSQYLSPPVPQNVHSILVTEAQNFLLPFPLLKEMA